MVGTCCCESEAVADEKGDTSCVSTIECTNSFCVAT